MSYKKIITECYQKNGKEYPNTLKLIIRDDTGQNNTFEIT